MITEESIQFLKRTPPFQFLEDAVIRVIAGNLSLEFSPEQTMILRQDGPPSSALRIIKKGVVKVYLSNDEEIVLDYSGEGDSFGYLSLVSGDKARANVLAVEDTICYMVPKNIVLEVINKVPSFNEYYVKSFLVNYLEKTYSEMQRKNLLFKEGEKLLYTTPVKEIISKGAVTLLEGTGIRDAAVIMSTNGISSVIIKDLHGSPVGIVTDRDLREKVVAKGIDTSKPVDDIMSRELITVEADSTCFDVLSTMIKRNIHHVLVNEEECLAGVVTNHDFMLLQGTSPLSVLKNIDRVQSIDELETVSDRINQTITILLKEGVKASYILRIITELHDRLIKKIIDFSIEEKTGCHCPFAIFAYGAEGRREETFKTVFRFAIAYNTDLSDCRKSEMEVFCIDLLAGLQNAFGKLKLPLFDLHPLGSEIPIYGDIKEWEDKILHALTSRERDSIITAKKMLDLRTIYGDASIVESLMESLYLRIKKESGYIPVLFEYTSVNKSPIGFLKESVVDENGKQIGKFDVKEKAASYIVNTLRVLSIVHNVHGTSTIERAGMLKRKGVIKQELENDICAAFEFLLHLLMQSQLMKKEHGLKIDNVIEPEKLSMLEKKSLKEIFHIIPVLHEVARQCLENKEVAVQ